VVLTIGYSFFCSFGKKFKAAREAGSAGRERAAKKRKAGFAFCQLRLTLLNLRFFMTHRSLLTD
jgi:hypothetical protein